MKKLMMMLVVGALALATQAATVNWVVSNVYTPSADLLSPGSTSGGAKMTTAQAANLMLSVFWKNGESWDAITPVDGKTTLTGNGIKASGILWSQDTAVANRDESNNAYFKVMLTYKDGDLTFTTEKESGAVALGNITAQTKSVTFNMNGATWTKTGGGSTGTPEPTSALLMLVGGSLLALRRKQR